MSPQAQRAQLAAERIALRWLTGNVTRLEDRHVRNLSAR